MGGGGLHTQGVQTPGEARDGVFPSLGKGAPPAPREDGSHCRPHGPHWCCAEPLPIAPPLIRKLGVLEEVHHTVLQFGLCKETVRQIRALPRAWAKKVSRH